MTERPRKTHLYVNHSPITKLVIQQILALPQYAAHAGESLIISTRGQRVGHDGVDELCFEDEALAQDFEHAYAFFYDAPPYSFEQLTLFVPQTRYPLGHFLLHWPRVQTVHYIEEGVGTMAMGRLDTRLASSARNTRGRFGLIGNTLIARIYKICTRVPIHLLRHPARVRELGSLVRVHGGHSHFMWRPEWHPRIGQLFAFHDVWPAPAQTLLSFPAPDPHEPSGATALLLLPAVYRSSYQQRFDARIDAFFEALPAAHHVQVKCHPSDTNFEWLARCRALHANVSEVDDRMMEAAPYCYSRAIPLCFHFNSSAKEYFKFLPAHGQHPRPAVIDLWPASLRLVDILNMDPASRPSSQFEYALPAAPLTPRAGAR